MKTYKLNYKDKNNKIISTKDILATDAIEAFKKAQTFLENSVDKSIKKVDIY